MQHCSQCVMQSTQMTLMVKCCTLSCTHMLALRDLDVLGLVAEAAQHGAAAHLVLSALRIRAQALHGGAAGRRQARVQPAGQQPTCQLKN